VLAFPPISAFVLRFPNCWRSGKRRSLQSKSRAKAWNSLQCRVQKKGVVSSQARCGHDFPNFVAKDTRIWQTVELLYSTGKSLLQVESRIPLIRSMSPRQPQHPSNHIQHTNLSYTGFLSLYCLQRRLACLFEVILWRLIEHIPLDSLSKAFVARLQTQPPFGVSLSSHRPTRKLFKPLPSEPWPSPHSLPCFETNLVPNPTQSIVN